MRKIAAAALCLYLALGAAGCAPETPRLDVTDGSYNQEFNAKIVNLDEGETAYYTLDGSEPGQDSIQYTEEGIPVTEGENQVKVIKFNHDGKSSEVLITHFTIAPQKPQMDTPAGVYDAEFAAKIINLKKGYRAYYTLDGTEPSQNSTLYTDAGIPITEGENQVKAIKFDAAGNCSEVLTANFTVTVQTPRLATPDGVYNAEFAAKIVNLREGYRAYYTMDGSEPDKNRKLYTEAGIPLTEGENQVKIIKYDESGNSSDVLTASLTIEPYEPDYSNYFTKLHKQGNIIYYVQHIPGLFSPYSSFPVYSQLWSIDLADGSSKIILDKDMHQFIIRDGIVYYEYVSNLGNDEGEIFRLLYSADLDEGSCQELLRHSDQEMDFVSLMMDEWFYYCYRNAAAGDPGHYNIYRFNVNSLATEPVSEKEGWGPAVAVDRDIIYTGAELNLYRFNVDTTKNTRISSDQSVRYKIFGDYIYYYTEKPESNVFRLRLDGTGKEQIPKINSREFVVVGDRIYYGNSRGLQSIRIDGDDYKSIYTNVPSNLQYYRGKIFFHSNYCLYCLDLATGQITKLFEGIDDQEGYLYFVDGEVYYVHTRILEEEAGLYHLTETGLEKLAGQEK